MPCFEMIQEYRAAVANGQEYYELPSDNPFARAAENELAQKGIRLASTIRMYSDKKLTMQVDMAVNDVWGRLTRSREVIDLDIDELHDMAVKFLPPPDPKKPTLQDFLRRHRPGAPQDLSDKPLPGRMVRKFVEEPIAEMVDGEMVTSYRFKEVWEVQEEKKEEPEKPKEKKTRKIQLEVEVDE
jgi:hypothetical protein